jgi:hypothetical protein
MSEKEMGSTKRRGEEQEKKESAKEEQTKEVRAVPNNLSDDMLSRAPTEHVNMPAIMLCPYHVEHDEQHPHVAETSPHNEYAHKCVQCISTTITHHCDVYR